VGRPPGSEPHGHHHPEVAVAVLRADQPRVQLS
jgi:hypothetical protein